MHSIEYTWLLKHPELDKLYAGEYIAVVGEAVVAHGKELREVLSEAEKIGKPLIHKVLRSDTELIV